MLNIGRFNSRGLRTLFVPLMALHSLTALAAHASTTHQAGSDMAVSATLTPSAPFPSEIPFYNIGPMALGGDGAFYGMTSVGGDNDLGIVYRLSKDGAFSTIHSFSSSEGQGQSSGLFQGLSKGPDGSLYGGTSSVYSTTPGPSELFRISPTGTYSVIHQFPADGSQGDPALVPVLTISANQTIYGCNSGGGSSGDGICFAIDARGTFQALHEFSAVNSQFANSDGAFPEVPVLDRNGNLYGVSQRGGTSGNGTIFKVAPSGTFTVLQTLDSTAPGIDVNLLTGADGHLYGYVVCKNVGSGTCNASGHIFSMSSSGTQKTLYKPTLGKRAARINQVLAGQDGNLYADVSSRGPAEIIAQVTPSGGSSVLHSFDADPAFYGCNFNGCRFGVLNVNLDGFAAILSQDSDGTIYGITAESGVYSYGTAFSLSTDGKFNLLFTFGGGNPYLGKPLYNILSGGDGSLYGMTDGSQANFYRLNPNGPMHVTASFSPSSAKVGDTVTLNWTSTDATSCSLNSDIPVNALFGTVAPNGSASAVASVKASPVKFPFEYYFLNEWVASVQCISSTGAIAGVALPLIRN